MAGASEWLQGYIRLCRQDDTFDHDAARPAASDHLARPLGVGRRVAACSKLGPAVHIAPALLVEEDFRSVLPFFADDVTHVGPHTHERVVTRHVPSRQREPSADAGELHTHAKVDLVRVRPLG